MSPLVASGYHTPFVDSSFGSSQTQVKNENIATWLDGKPEAIMGVAAVSVPIEDRMEAR